MKISNFMRTAIAAAAVVGVATVAWAADITGAGATFPYPIYGKWAAAYKEKTGVGLNYQSIGSGGGIKQIKAATVTFGASDMPLKPDELDAAGLIQFPTVIGGVVPIYNLPGIAAGALTFDGPTLADIFAGKITKWNDPAVARLNPGVKLPGLAINVAHRSDGSGTTFIWTNYLSKVSPSWKSSIGEGTSVEWPAGFGAKGNEGVAGVVKQTMGSIGYVEYAYVVQNKLAYGKMMNAAGKTVSPESAAFQSAAASADWSGAPGMYLLLTNAPGADAWPVAGATFILMYKKPKDAAASLEALKFFDWCYANGDQMAAELDYVPMPDNVVGLIKKHWATNIKASNGQPLFASN
jgi:phosphate transport system substrate-binding protein